MAFYDSIRLEKGMYGTPGKSFTQVLEEVDPSGNYEGTELSGLDAYQRQLKRFRYQGRGILFRYCGKIFSDERTAPRCFRNM